MRVLIKASGQSFAGGQGFGIDPVAVGAFADEVVAASHHAEIAIVVGGGNILRAVTPTAG